MEEKYYFFAIRDASTCPLAWACVVALGLGLNFTTKVLTRNESCK